MRPPNWHRDELILALNLYHKISHGRINHANPEIIVLSELLNRLPIHPHADVEKFRNPNGVSMKLGNFLAVDPSYSGKGLTRMGKLDKVIFDEFYYDREGLERIAVAIMGTANDETLLGALRTVPDESEDGADAGKEGRVLYKLHKYRERNIKLVKRKKEQYLKAHGRLDCEACGFVFRDVYGELGADFIECHHRRPLAELNAETKTTLKDLALVCANCHRMLHRRLSTLTVASLRKILQKSK